MERSHPRVVGTVLVVMIVVALMAQRPSATDLPLFEVGAVYSVAWDCTPTYMAEAVSATMASGRRLNPCYAEALKIRTVRKDGWIVVQDMADGAEWTANPARMIAVRKHVVSLRASQ